VEEEENFSKPRSRNEPTEFMKYLSLQRVIGIENVSTQDIIAIGFTYKEE